MYFSGDLQNSYFSFICSVLKIHLKLQLWLLLIFNVILPESDETLIAFDLLCFTSKEESAEWADKFEKLLLTKPGLGTRCMDPKIHEIK